MTEALDEARELKLSVTIAPELSLRLEEIAKANNSTIGAIVTEAINLVEIADRQRKAGKHLGFASSEEQLDTKVVGSFSR